MSVIKQILGGVGEAIGLDDLIDSLGKNVDRFVTTKEEREKLKQSMKQLIQSHELKVQAAALENLKSARSMYQKDSSLQKIYAIVFLVGYLVLTAGLGILIYNLAVAGSIEVPAWAISLISAIWGGMSGKVNTIVDFLFGGSQDGREQQRVMNEIRKVSEKKQG